MTKKILIVDDSEMSRFYHSSVLSQAGYEVVCAENGYEALEMIISSGIDLVVTDINMPVMDGYSFIKKLREELSESKVPVIIISTENGESENDFNVTESFDFFIHKPVDPTVLLDKVQMLLKE